MSIEINTALNPAQNNKNDKTAPVDSKSNGIETNTTANATSDTIELTEDTLKMQRLEKAIAGQPSIDDDKVSRIKALIEQGEYQINPENVAEKMIKIDFAQINQNGGK